MAQKAQVDESEIVQVPLHFYQHEGRPVLLADEVEVGTMRREFEAQVKRMDAEIEQAAANENNTAQTRIQALETLRERVKTEFAEWCEQHERLLAGANEIVYEIAPFSYYDRMKAEDKHTSIDIDTSESRRKDDFVRDELLTRHVIARHWVGETGKTVREEMSVDAVRKLKGPVARRLWRVMKGVSEPDEADLFRTPVSA